MDDIIEAIHDDLVWVLRVRSFSLFDVTLCNLKPLKSQSRSHTGIAFAKRSCPELSCNGSAAIMIFGSKGQKRKCIAGISMIVFHHCTFSLTYDAKSPNIGIDKTRFNVMRSC